MAFLNVASGQFYHVARVYDPHLSQPTTSNFGPYHVPCESTVDDDLFVMFTYIIANWTNYGGETARQKMLAARQSSLQVCDSRSSIY
jgi:hypothetical protein